MSPVTKLTVSQAFTGGQWAAKALCLPVCIVEELLAEPRAPTNHHVAMYAPLKDVPVKRHY